MNKTFSQMVYVFSQADVDKLKEKFSATIIGEELIDGKKAIVLGINRDITRDDIYEITKNTLVSNTMKF